jgi:hypothetical protein
VLSHYVKHNYFFGVEMKIQKYLITIVLAAVPLVSFAAERVAFPGSACTGASVGGSSESILNRSITCPIVLPYAWGPRKITKVRIDLSGGYSPYCTVYSTNTSGDTITSAGVTHNVGDVVVNLNLANDYAHIECNNYTPSWASSSMKVNGYVVESN